MGNVKREMGNVKCECGAEKTKGRKKKGKKKKRRSCGASPLGMSGTGFFDSTYQLSGDRFDASFNFARIANLRGGELQMRAFVRLAVGFNQSHLPCVICRSQPITHEVIVMHNLVSVGKLDQQCVLCFKCCHFKLARARRVYSFLNPLDFVMHGLIASWQS